MFCLACTAWSTDRMCRRCDSMVRRAPATLVGNGLLVRAAYTHEGPARQLVHALKYRAVAAAAMPLARAMADQLPTSATCLVPVPRARARAIRYGVDPAAVLAAAVSGLGGIPVRSALSAPWWWPRHAGATRGERASVRFRQRLGVPPGAILVDDVVTTGATVTAASQALRPSPSLVLAGTVAPRIRVAHTAPVEVA